MLAWAFGCAQPGRSLRLMLAKSSLHTAPLSLCSAWSVLTLPLCSALCHAQFMGVTLPPGPVCILSEFLARGSLADVLAAARQASDALPWPLRLELAVGAATGEQLFPLQDPFLLSCGKDGTLCFVGGWACRAASRRVCCACWDWLGRLCHTRSSTSALSNATSLLQACCSCTAPARPWCTPASRPATCWWTSTGPPKSPTSTWGEACFGRAFIIVKRSNGDEQSVNALGRQSLRV